jgi:methylase of polypeptide subunit release factors
LKKQKTINIEQAAKILGISMSTARNWIKCGLLSDNSSIEEAEELKYNIENGRVGKLNKRANKVKSNKNFVPSEYSTSKTIKQRIRKISELSQSFFSDLDECLYNLAVCYLISKREIFELFGTLEFERSIFEKIIFDYGKDKKLNLEFIEKARPHFIKFNKLECHDPLGFSYQSIRSEGNKSKHGSYYTPSQITDEMSLMLGNSIETFFDPCCGTGSFLLSVAKNKNLLIDNIYGSDIDKNAVFIAKINLLLHFKHSAKEPKIFCTDILNSSDSNLHKDIIGKVDAIATNPPWGANKNEKLSEKYKALLSSNEIFSMIIAKSLEIVKERGECVFVLPVSILNIKAHSNIRKILATKTTIVSIKEHGKTFTQVFTPIILMHLKKSIPNPKNIVSITTKTLNHKIEQKRFVNTKDYIFDINITTEEKNLIKKIYSQPHLTLKDNADWALGIITGNNKFFINNEHIDGYEPIYKGNDISHYKLNKPSHFINYQREMFQQVAPEKYYRVKKKLIYRFISNKLVFTLDKNQYLTLNSANILIPKIPEYSIKSTLAFLNSSIFQFLYSKKFSTHKVLRSDLEQLPFPKLLANEKKKLDTLVSKALNDENVKEKIDNFIFKLFKLSDKEIEIIKKS